MTASGDRALPVEAAEELHRLLYRELLRELGLLERDPQPLAQLAVVLAPAAPEHGHLAGVGRVQPLADLDGRRLARTVGSQKAEALAGEDLEIEAIHRDDILIGLAEVPNLKCWLAGGRLHGGIITPPV